MFKISFDFTTVEFILGSQNKGMKEIVSLSFLPVSFVSSFSQTSIRKFCIWTAKTQGNAYFQTGEKKKFFKKIFLPICLSTPSSQVVQLYLTPSKAYILGQTLP